MQRSEIIFNGYDNLDKLENILSFLSKEINKKNMIPVTFRFYPLRTLSRLKEKTTALPHFDEPAIKNTTIQDANIVTLVAHGVRMIAEFLHDHHEALSQPHTISIELGLEGPGLKNRNSVDKGVLGAGVKRDSLEQLAGLFATGDYPAGFTVNLSDSELTSKDVEPLFLAMREGKCKRPFTLHLYANKLEDRTHIVPLLTGGLLSSGTRLNFSGCRFEEGPYVSLNDVIVIQGAHFRYDIQPIIAFDYEGFALNKVIHEAAHTDRFLSEPFELENHKKWSKLNFMKKEFIELFQTLSLRLRDVRLPKIGMSPENCAAFINSLCINPYLEAFSISLENQESCFAFIKPVIAILPCPTLRRFTLNLSGNSMPLDSMRLLFDSLSSVTPRLESVNLDFSKMDNFSDETLDLILAFATSANCPRELTLILDNNLVLDKGLTKVCDALPKCSAKLTLHMWSCGFTREGLMKFCDTLKSGRCHPGLIVDLGDLNKEIANFTFEDLTTFHEALADYHHAIFMKKQALTRQRLFQPASPISTVPIEIMTQILNESGLGR